VNSADLCPIAVFGNVFRQPVAVTAQKVLSHIFRIPAGRWFAAHGFGHFSNVNRRRTTANAQISDVIFPGCGGKITDFLAIAL
jgi:hypothetical protein